MRVVVAGDFRNPILLDTKEATALLIESNDGRPNVIFKMMEDGNGWIRKTKGEDSDFDVFAKELGLI